MKRRKLSEITSVITKGTTPTTLGNGFSIDGIPFVRAEDVNGEAINWHNLKLKITNDTHNHELKRSKIFPGDVLLTIAATIGRTAVVPDDSIELNTNQAVSILRPIQEIVSPSFLNYALSSSFVTEQWKCLQRGGGQLNLNLEQVGNLEIPLPPLDEQRRIAGILDQADRLRRLRSHARQLTDSFLQSVFIEMFGDPRKNPKHLDKVQLGDVADVQGGLQLSAKRRGLELSLPYLRVANVYRNRLNLSEIKYIDLTQAEFERTKLEKGDILVVEGHGNPEEIGRCAIWDGSIENCVHQNHLIRVRTDGQKVNNIFLSFFINSIEGRQYFTSESNTTSGLNTISTSVVKECVIPLPSIDLQLVFAKRQYKTLILQSQYLEAERQAELNFQALLHQAFTGQLSSKKVPA